MSDKFPFIQNHDIVPAISDRYDYFSEVAYSDTGEIVSFENAYHAAALLDIFFIESTAVDKHIVFYSSRCDGSDAGLIEPLYYREKINDGSDQWGARQTITDGVFEISDGSHCPSTSDYHQFLFEFEDVEIHKEGVAGGAGSDTNNCIFMRVISNDIGKTPPSDADKECFFRVHYLMNPLRYSNPASSSYNNLC